MPYTPPAPRSPALASPSLQDAASSKTLAVPPPALSPPRSPGFSKPNLPRSSSFSKSQRNRDAHADHAISHDSTPVDADVAKLNVDTNLAQKSFILTSPGHSALAPEPNSSDDDDEHGRDRAEKVAELEQAVRESLLLNGAAHTKDVKPATGVSAASHRDATPRDTSLPSDKGKLSSSARKISHSRSSTDSAIVFSPSASAAETPLRLSASDGSEDEIDAPSVKPPFVRKKSGELVKPAIRPNLRRKVSSMPGTPTYGKKGVHFKEDITQVRHFLQVDRPMAVSAGGSPVDTLDDETEFPFRRQEPASSTLDIALGNFPRQSHERDSQTVRLDNLALSTDQKSLVGEVVVANISFHKHVVARFTFDSWRTTSEVTAQYNADVRRKPKDDGFDLFSFNIRLSDQANLEKRTMFLCVRYSVDGKEFWDNNSSQNFQVDFTRKQAAASSPSSSKPQSTQSPPRSRKGSHQPISHSQNSHGQGNGFLRAKPSLDDDFSGGFELGSPFKFRQQEVPQLPDNPPPRRTSASGNQFASRYDFGSSLSAALSQAQAQLGDRSGIKERTGELGRKPKASSAELGRHVPDASKSTESPHADGLLSNKQPLESQAYQEFVSKFCFFGSGKPASSSNATPPQGTPQHAQSKQLRSSNDGSNDEDYHEQVVSSRTRAQENRQSASNMPSAVSSGLSTDYANFKIPQDFFAQQDMADSTSRGSTHGYDSRSASPVPMSFGYAQETHSGWFSSGTPTPPAIHG